MGISDPVRTAHSILREQLRQGGSVTLSVTTTSMFPLIRPGESVFVAPVRSGDLQPGDMVLIDSGDEFFVHRFLGLNESRALTRGDHIRRFDEPVPLDWIIGKVVKIIRSDGALDLTSAGCRFQQRIMALYFLGQGRLLNVARKVKALFQRVES